MDDFLTVLNDMVAMYESDAGHVLDHVRVSSDRETLQQAVKMAVAAFGGGAAWEVEEVDTDPPYGAWQTRTRLRHWPAGRYHGQPADEYELVGSRWRLTRSYPAPMIRVNDPDGSATRPGGTAGQETPVTAEDIRGTWTGIARLGVWKSRNRPVLNIVSATNEKGAKVRLTQWMPRNGDQWVAKVGDGACVEFTAKRYSKTHSVITAAVVTANAKVAVEAAAASPAEDVEETVTGTLARLLKYMGARDMHGHHLNVMMVGPAGCGKSTVARQAADKLGLAFYADSFNRDTPPWQLTGRREPGEGGAWGYMPSQFVTAYETGGVYLADEMDAADANTLLTLNMALANGHMAVPERVDKPVAKRHTDFVCIAAANTYGSGSRVYVGREELDEATLSRFVPMSVEYDIAYEAGVLGKSTHGAEIKVFRDAIRRAIDEGKLRRVFSTRHLIQWAALRDAGINMDEIIREFFAAWSTADRQVAASKGVRGAAVVAAPVASKFNAATLGAY